MDLPVTVALKRPITMGEETITSLTFDEPDLGAQIAFADLEATLSEPQMMDQGNGVSLPVYSGKDTIRMHLFWIAQLSGVSEEVAKKIKKSDADAVSTAVSDILEFVSLDADDQGGAGGNVPPAK